MSLVPSSAAPDIPPHVNPSNRRRIPRRGAPLVRAGVATGVLLGVLACGHEQPESPSVRSVAIIDTGVQPGLPAFADYEVIQRSPAASGPHGTMVLSVLLGVAPESGPRLPPDRVRITSYDVGSDPNADRLAEAIHQAVDDGAEVISVSMGVRRPDPDLERAVSRAVDQNVAVVAAVGNVPFLPPDYPARYEPAIAVTALDPDGRLWEGAPMRGADATAPGVDIAVLTREGATVRQSGTSLAAPAVARDIVRGLLTGDLTNPTDYRPPPVPAP